VAAAVLLSLDSVCAGESGTPGAVMDLLAVLSAGGVRRSLIHAAAREGLSGRDGSLPDLAPEVVDGALARLAGASLLTFSGDGSAVSAHRLVMRVIRENLAASNALTAVCEAVADLLDGLAKSLSKSWHEDRPAARDLVEQIMALYESSARCPADSALVRRLLGLRGRAVFFLSHLGDSAQQPIAIAEPLLADLKRVLGADHPDTLAARVGLAIAYQRTGRIAEAITLLEQTLADPERVLGTNHPDTLAGRISLANTYREAGRTAEALTLHEQNLADLERVLGADHPETLTTRNNLANDYRLAGRTAEAITLHEQTLTDQERVLGADHPNTLATRDDLASDYRLAGRTTEAIAVYEQTVAAQERVLGADHPETLRTRDNLALACREAGRPTDRLKPQPSGP
jgi:tetratricopeptide (TPR) repeat protein